MGQAVVPHHVRIFRPHAVVAAQHHAGQKGALRPVQPFHQLPLPAQDGPVHPLAQGQRSCPVLRTAGRHGHAAVDAPDPRHQGTVDAARIIMECLLLQPAPHAERPLLQAAILYKNTDFARQGAPDIEHAGYAALPHLQGRRLPLAFQGHGPAVQVLPGRADRFVAGTEQKPAGQGQEQEQGQQPLPQPERDRQRRREAACGGRHQGREVCPENAQDIAGAKKEERPDQKSFEHRYLQSR